MLAEKLIIYGKPYIVNNLNDLPDTPDPSKVCTVRTGENITVFLWCTVLTFKLQSISKA